MSIDGPVFAVVTPFDSFGRIDEGALIRNLDFLSRSGVRSIVVNGTTGEFSSLSSEERNRVVALCRSNYQGKIIAHISSCSYVDSNMMAESASDNGADALLLLPPYYFDIKDRGGLVSYYKKSLDQVDLPAYIYNFPFYTKVSLCVDDVRQIYRACENVVGLKDSGGDFQLSSKFNEISDDFDVFVGGDSVALEVLRAGMKGSVTGAGNPFPEFLVRLNEAWAQGDEGAAIAAQNAFDVWNELRSQFNGYEVSIVKEALAYRVPDFPMAVRSPLVPLEEPERALLRENYSSIMDEVASLGRQ
ncbi:MAG: dihydrodipicolinate synthase family protein [Candidatus Thiodiazotropha sp.]